MAPEARGPAKNVPRGAQRKVSRLAVFKEVDAPSRAWREAAAVVCRWPSMENELSSKNEQM